MTGANLDTVGASQQTRDHQRDSHVRLGACVFFVLWPLLWIVTSVYGVAVPFLVIPLFSGLVAILIGYLAYRRGVAVTTKAHEQDRAERVARKQAELDRFKQSDHS